jgi:hypothetical protein
MGCAVQTGECPVRVYETNDESGTELRPAGVVDEGGEDEIGVLVGLCPGGNDDQDNEEGDKRRVQGDGG